MTYDVSQYRKYVKEDMQEVKHDMQTARRYAVGQVLAK